jgi:hypothetical protein
MKISKTRLKEIIKEELSGLGEGDSADRKWASNPNNPEFEGDESNQDAEVRLQQVVTSLGAGEDFVHKIRDAIAEAAATQTRARALELMVDALEMLSPMQEADTPDEEESEEEEALVLPDLGAAGVKKSRERMKHRANELERQKRLRYKK